ncbi:MAG: hypothetical protein Q7T57_03585 [Dehalococcoidales bacterium]|nr:hypothetical protein [Dehalococcoidales bacterium]
MLDADRGVSFKEGHGKVIEKTLSVQSDLDFRGVLGIVPFGGPFGTVPELLFEKKGLIPALQQLLVSQ